MTTLAQDLAELEQANTEVRAAAGKLDAVVARIVKPTCRYCGDPVGAKGAVHNKCEHEADRLADEDES